jgi:3-oxoacyl-[acyl-carrier-protein] synthase III
VRAIQRAIADAGIEKRAIDGFLSAGMEASGAETVILAEYLGIQHRYIDGTMTGGSSFEFHVQHAAAAIRDGLCDTVLVSYRPVISCAARRTSDIRVKSARTKSTLASGAAAARISASAAALRAGSRPTPIRCQPMRTSATAVALPMPALAPVTTAVRSSGAPILRLIQSSSE